MSDYGPEMQIDHSGANGLRLHDRRASSGSPVMLLHGFTDTSYAWRKVMPLLAERHTVIAAKLESS